eukprot:scaffold176697_cov16-Prasinocladus_malaysianus.AAC.1
MHGRMSMIKAVNTYEVNDQCFLLIEAKYERSICLRMRSQGFSVASNNAPAHTPVPAGSPRAHARPPPPEPAEPSPPRSP